jgi:predicted  nucleic acid-binding Zn-ribbon protein
LPEAQPSTAGTGVWRRNRRRFPAQLKTANRHFNKMNELIENMFELQSLEFEETVQPNTEERMAALRAKIPKLILDHYDRMGDRGKKGVALVRHQTCSACHMGVPLGQMLNLRKAADVCLCGSCGRYLYLREETTPVSSAVPAKKTAAKSSRKQLAHAL